MADRDRVVFMLMQGQPAGEPFWSVVDWLGSIGIKRSRVRGIGRRLNWCRRALGGVQDRYNFFVGDVGEVLIELAHRLEIGRGQQSCHLVGHGLQAAQRLGRGHRHGHHHACRRLLAHQLDGGQQRMARGHAVID